MCMEDGEAEADCDCDYCIGYRDGFLASDQGIPSHPFFPDPTKLLEPEGPAEFARREATKQGGK